MINGAPAFYAFAGNLRVSKITSSDTVCFHKDHLGSTSGLSQQDGSVIESGEYMPFGEDRDTNSLLATSAYKFTDQEQDDGTGLYNYDARLYDPVLGQFVMADSIVPDLYNPQSLNRYAYCLNNPLIYTDPSGNIFVSGSIAVGYSAYVVGGLIASGIVYYGTPIAADLGKKIGNWWAEKKNKIERDEEGRTRREPNDRDKGHDHGSQGEALEDALDMWDVDDPETEDIKPDHSRENGKGPNGEPMENIGYILNFRG